MHSTFSFTGTILLAFFSIQRDIVTLIVGELQVSPHTLHPQLLQLAVQLLEQRLTSQIPTGKELDAFATAASLHSSAVDPECFVRIRDPAFQVVLDPDPTL